MKLHILNVRTYSFPDSKDPNRIIKGAKVEALGNTIVPRDNNFCAGCEVLTFKIDYDVASDLTNHKDYIFPSLYDVECNYTRSNGEAKPVIMSLTPIKSK